MLNRNLIEKEFGYMNGHVYLNSSLVGMPPERVKAACRTFMDDYTASFNETIKADLLEKRKMAKANIAEYINADQSEIVFEKNVTESLSTFAMGYDALVPGTNAIIVNSDFPNCIYPWINAHKVRGFDLKVYEATRGQIVADEIIDLMDENTKVFSISMVQSGWGYYADIEKLGNACFERGIKFVLDGFQGLGRLCLDVKKCHINYLACGGFKALMGTWGAAFIYADKDTITHINPPTAGYQSAVSHVLAPGVTTDFSEIHFLDSVQRLEAGSQCTYAIESMGLGVSLLLELGKDEVQNHVLSLDRLLRKSIQNLPLDVVTPEDPERLSGMVVVLYPEKYTQRCKEIFATHNIHATLRDGYIRFTIALFNTEEDIRIVVDALSQLTAEFK